MKPVAIIGMGLSPLDLTERHKRRIRKADILMGGERHLSHFKGTNAEKKAITKDLKGAIRFIKANMEDRDIVVLASGDPLFFGIGSYIAKALGPEQVEIMPNISSIAGAFARIKEAWGRAAVISLHGRDRERDLFKAVKDHECVALFTDPKKNPAWVAEILLSNSKGADPVRMAVFEKLGSPDERFGWYELKEAAALSFDDPNVVILKRADGGGKKGFPLHLGMPEEAFEHGHGLITKSEVRAVVLAKLRLLPWHTLWDLGAGCGSVGVEANLLLPQGQIFAVEKRPERVQQIRANIRRFGISNIEVVQATLPRGLEGLPAPDRVFVGGGGKRLGRIITAAASALRPGGVMVINAVLLDNLQTALKTLRKNALETDVIQMQIQRSKSMPWSERLEAQNPVWIISGEKEGL